MDTLAGIEMLFVLGKLEYSRVVSRATYSDILAGIILQSRDDLYHL